MEKSCRIPSILSTAGIDRLSTAGIIRLSTAGIVRLSTAGTVRLSTAGIIPNKPYGSLKLLISALLYTVYFNAESSGAYYMAFSWKVFGSTVN